MKTFELEGKSREIADNSADKKRALKALRKENRIPAVIYGGEKVIPFSVESTAARNLIYTPDIYLVKLSIDGKPMNAILKELQFHPVTDLPLHIDFLEVSPSKPIVMDVPVVLEGHAEGVKAGGRLNQQMRRLKVRGMFDVIPEFLTVNVDKLTIGKSIQVGALQFDGLELLNSKHSVVCSVLSTRAAIETTAAPAADAAAAPAADAAAPAADAAAAPEKK